MLFAYKAHRYEVCNYINISTKNIICERLEHFKCACYADKGSKIFQEEAGSAPIRQSGNISISFTPRVFPTPQRESLSHEEETVCNFYILHY